MIQQQLLLLQFVARNEHVTKRLSLRHGGTNFSVYHLLTIWDNIVLLGLYKVFQGHSQLTSMPKIIIYGS